MPEGIVEEARPYVPSFQYVVDDVSGVGDEALRRRALTGLGLLVTVCLRDVRARNAVEAMKPWIAEWVDVMRAGIGPRDVLYVFRYIYEVKGVEEAEGFGEFLAREVGPEAKELMVTAAEQLRLEGRLEGERALLLKQLRQRFGELDAETQQRVASAESWQLEQWGTRVLTAATLDGVMVVSQ